MNMLTTPASAGSPLLPIGREAERLLAKLYPLKARWWELCDDEHKEIPDHDEEARVNANAQVKLDTRLDKLSKQATRIAATDLAALRVKAILVRRGLLAYCTPRGNPTDPLSDEIILALSFCDDVERLAGAGA